jgi:hypothetical protein
MARYLNKGKPPGSQVNGYAFFPQGEIAEFPPSVPPSRYWVPLDDEAVECMKKLKAQLEAKAKTTPTAPRGPSIDDIVIEIPSDEPDRSLVEPANEERTLGQMAPGEDSRINRGPVEGETGKADGDPFGLAGRDLNENPDPKQQPKKNRAADKVV